MKRFTCGSFHYLQAVEQTADGALLLLHVQTHLSDHGPQQYNRLSGWGLQLLHHLWTAEGRELHGPYKTCHQLYCRTFGWSELLKIVTNVLTNGHDSRTRTAWSSISQPCMYAVSMSMQWVRLSLRLTANRLFAKESRSDEQRSTCAARSLTLACLWNTWCRAETCSLSRTGCRAPRGELRGQRCLLMQRYGLCLPLKW